jgi:integrase
VPATISAATVAKAKADARPGAKRYEVVDARARGLVLRVSATGAQWQLRYALNGKDTRLALGGIDMWTIAEARDLVGRAQAMLRDRTGLPDADWLDRMRRVLGKAEATPMATPVAKPRDLFAWTYKQGRDAYIDEIARTRRPATAEDYADMLGHPEMIKLDKKPLPSITRADVAGIVARIHRSGRESTAEHIVRVVSPFWKWLARDGQLAKSGIKADVMDGLAAPERTLDESDDDAGEYVPPLEEVGRIIAICRSGAIDPIIAGAIELAAWTGQRRRAVAQAGRDQFEPIGDGRGLWHMPPASRKTRTKSGAKKRPHVIPLPPAVWACVERAQTIAEKRGSDFLFPQLRVGRGGKAKTSLSGSAMSHNMGFMPGILASPHDFRRALGTHGEFRFGLLRSDTQAILDHSSGSGDVTGTHYSLHDGTHRTWPIMTTWVDGLQPYIDAAIRDLEPVGEIRAAIASRRYGDDELREAAE